MNLLNALKSIENKIDIIPVIFKSGGVLEADLSRDFHIIKPRLDINKNRPARIMNRILWLSKQIRKIKPDIIYTRVQSMNALVALATKFSRIRVPIVATEDNVPTFEDRFGKYSKKDWKDLLSRECIKQLFHVL